MNSKFLNLEDPDKICKTKIEGQHPRLPLNFEGVFVLQDSFQDPQICLGQDAFRDMLLDPHPNFSLCSILFPGMHGDPKKRQTEQIKQGGSADDFNQE